MRSSFFLVALVFSLLGWTDPALAEGTLWVNAENVLFVRTDEGFRIEISMLVPVPLAIAWQVLTDFAGMPRFVPNLESSRIITGQGSNTVRVEQRGTASFGPFSQKFESVREIEMRPMQEIHVRQLSGTARRMESWMHLKNLGDQQTRLNYRAEIVADTLIPPLIGPTLLQHEMAEQFSAMISEMVKRNAPPKPVQAGSATGSR